MSPDHKLLFIVTGSRGYGNPEQVRKWARELPEEAFLMEGECVKSPDVWAREGFLETHPAEQLLKRPANWRPGGVLNRRAGIERNGTMALEGRRWKDEGHCVRVVAFWDTQSNGTADMIRSSRAVGLHTTVNKHQSE